MADPRKNESKQDYLKRCTAMLVGDEDKSPDQAFAQCNSMWQQAKKKEHSELRRPFNLATPIRLEEIPPSEEKGESAPGFLINAYTGKPVEMGWLGTFIFDVEGIQAMDQMPVLRQHSHDRIVGASSKFWKDKNNVFIQGKFSQATEDSREVRELAEEGYPWQASVGIWPLEIEYLAEEKESARVNGIEVQGPIEIWKKSQIREVSFVSLGADDDTAGIGIQLSDSCPVSVQVQYSKEKPKEKEVKHMELKELLEKLVEAQPSVDDLALSFPEFVEHYKDMGKEEGEKGYIKQGREMGEEGERTRIVEIIEADADKEITLKAIKDGTASNDFYRMAYDHMRGVQDDKLKKLADNTPDDVVPQEPADVEPKIGDVGVEVATLASALAKEKGIPMDKATNQVLEANPKLKEQYLATFDS